MRILLLILTIFVISSGCVEENNATQSNESAYKGSVNGAPENISPTNLSSEEENIPEIEVTSFSSIYMHDNTERVYEYIFSWDNVPGNESQRLISYLQEEKNRMSDPEISWGSHAQIIKSNENKTICFYFSNSTELKLDDKKGNVLRTPDAELKVREVNGKYKVLITPQILQSDELEGKEVNGKLCIYKVKEKNDGYNITESYYAAYGLSIKNNGSKDLDFKLNELHVRDGDYIFNTTIEPIYRDSFSEVLSDLEKETKLGDTTLSPGQTINGSVVFQVDSLYNKSFLLMYNDTPITSASFEKSIEALSAAERYNYSVIFGKPPYYNGYDGVNDSHAVDPVDSFEPNLRTYPYIWANWVNRSIFEVFNRADIELFNKDIFIDMSEPSKNFIPGTELVYALKVIPERNITVNAHLVKRNDLVVSGSPFKVVDDTGEELINSSQTDRIGILSFGDSVEIDRMNFSNATIVRISFMSHYSGARLSSVNQDVIMDEEQNIAVASSYCRNFIS